MEINYAFILMGLVVVTILIMWLRGQSNAIQLPPPGQYVTRELYETIVAQNDMLRAELAEKEQEIRTHLTELAARAATIRHLEHQLQHQNHELRAQQNMLRLEFENMANRFLEEKGKVLSAQHVEQLQSVLSPLREKIAAFEQHVEHKFLEETREKSALKKEIEQLVHLNQQLSQDANQLAAALKGQSKWQGNWGEYQLELLLEKSGLSKGIHFMVQKSMRDEQGNLLRPDFIIQLPENKQLILDAKVSLTAFERYFNDPDPVRKQQHLKSHIESLRAHVAELSKKNYPFLPGMNAPDYLLMFIPLETALTEALQADPKLLTDALEKNVVLVSTSSLLTTLRTVSYLWKQEKQARSVQEIARQSGLLYDKFVAFVEDLRVVGSRLISAQHAYDDAMNKLVNSTRFGDTLVGRAEKLRELGAKSSKQLPGEILPAEISGEFHEC